MKPTIGRVGPRVMPKSAPQKAATKSEPTGLPAPRAPVREEDPSIAAAKAAVEEYENQKRMLDEMKEDWEKNFPEASLARQDILQQEDIVVDSINKAKPLVAAAKQTIGDFKATRKFEKAHYDTEELTQILSTLDNHLDIFEEMLQSGIVKSLDLDREASIAWFAQRPNYAETFQAAFKEEREATCAVSIPKLR